MHHTNDSADWDYLAFALADLARGVKRRWDATGGELDGKRAARHGRMLRDLTDALSAVAEVTRESRFASSTKAADMALADALSGPLAAFGEDLRIGFRDTDVRDPVRAHASED